MRNPRGKVAAITGAGSGIGRALAVELATRGCDLALSDIDAQRLADTAREARLHGVRVSTEVVDVADRAAVFRWADACRATHGKVNLIFNNAGVSLTSAAEATQPADFQWLMGIDFWGVVHGTQAFMPLLRASGDGHVINISSVFGIVAMPTQSAYSAAKFAVRGFTEALRMELELEGCAVSATCVHPGGVATNIALAGRIDPALERISGIDAETQRQRANRVIQVSTPQAAALQIIRGVERNARRVLVGHDARMTDLLARVMGAGYQRVVLNMVRRMIGPAAARKIARAAR